MLAALGFGGCIELSKEFLRQYVFAVAVNAGLMDDQLASQIELYDPEAFSRILSMREKDLEKRAKEQDPASDPSFYRESAESVRKIVANLQEILGG